MRYARPVGRNAGYPGLAGVVLLKGLQQTTLWPKLPDKDDILARADRLLRNEFSFLNRVHRFEAEIDWQCPSASHLWRYQLHYFGCAWDLGIAHRACGDRSYYLKFRELVESWMAQNPPGRLDGWHPYTISLRVVHWIYAYELFSPVLFEDERFLRRFLRSLYAQCDFLAHHLEYQGYGNHLLANLKALIFAGVFFAGRAPERWLETGLRLLNREMDEQVLGDGGHFERSPMYHLIAMKDLIECLSALEGSGRSLPAELIRKVRDMARFARAVRTPDGGIPLLNDSSRDLAPDLDELVEMAGHFCGQGTPWKPRVFSFMLLGLPRKSLTVSPQDDGASSVALKETGYFVLRDGDKTAMILDCGPVCPDYLPPHAHADTLSYELWVGGVNLITDSGVYEYTAGAWRDFFRSSRAHNTVVIDGEDQSEVWGSFRVARRAYPRDVVWVATEAGDYFSGGHDGYRRLDDPVLHHRRVVRVRGRFWLVLDRVTGRGTHRAESFVHFHPDARVDRVSPGRVRASCGGQTLTLWPFGHDQTSSCAGQTDPLQGWYSPTFGVRRSRQSFCLTKAGSAPFFLGYLLVAGEVSDAEVTYRLGETEQYEVHLDGTRWMIEVLPAVSELRIQQEGP